MLKAFTNIREHKTKSLLWCFEGLVKANWGYVNGKCTQGHVLILHQNTFLSKAKQVTAILYNQQ